MTITSRLLALLGVTQPIEGRFAWTGYSDRPVDDFDDPRDPLPAPDPYAAARWAAYCYDVRHNANKYEAAARWARAEAMQARTERTSR